MQHKENTTSQEVRQMPVGPLPARVPETENGEDTIFMK